MELRTVSDPPSSFSVGASWEEPSEPIFAGITLIGESAEELDAYSTALFTMTAEEAFKFVNANGIDAVFVTADRNIIITDGIKDGFSLLLDGGTL